MYKRQYLDLCQRLVGFAQQAASIEVQGIGITYWGSIVDLDAVPLTRAVQKGWLAGIAGDEGVNDVNAPHKLKALGIEVEVTKSSSDADYNELIEVKAISADGSETSVRGTLLGKADVNISFMGLGRDGAGDHALMALASDHPVAEDILETLKSEVGIQSASLIELG